MKCNVVGFTSAMPIVDSKECQYICLIRYHVLNYTKQTIRVEQVKNVRLLKHTQNVQYIWFYNYIKLYICRSNYIPVKGKVYKTVVRPAMMYDAETWAVKKAQEKKLDVAEMRMLRWMSGVT